jgi:hypothetical protein
MLITGGCALELSLSVHEAAVLGIELGALTMALAVWGSLSAARRISHELAGMDLPSVVASRIAAEGTDSRWPATRGV